MSPIAVGHSTPLGSALAPIVADAYALEPDVSCTLIGRGLNDTYAVDAGDRSYVLRLYRARWRTSGDVLFEVDALRHAAARGVPLAGPIARVDGEWVTPVDAPEGSGWRSCSSACRGRSP